MDNPRGLLRSPPALQPLNRRLVTIESLQLIVVRPTGEQGSGILKSMSDANCFIILDDATGNVEAGTSVEVQLLEGIV